MNIKNKKITALLNNNEILIWKHLGINSNRSQFIDFRP